MQIKRVVLQVIGTKSKSAYHQNTALKIKILVLARLRINSRRTVLFYIKAECNRKRCVINFLVVSLCFFAVIEMF